MAKTTRARTSRVDEPADERVPSTSTPDPTESAETELTQGTMLDAAGQPLRRSTIEFMGRTMAVQVPDEVQLAVMRRFGERYKNAPGGKVSLEEAMAMTERAISVVQSVLAGQEDRDWVEDGLLSAKFRITDVMPIVQEAVTALRDANAPANREERRRAKPVKSRPAARLAIED